MQPIDAYNTIITLLSATGLVYLMYSGRYVVGYRRFFVLVLFGLFLSVLGGPMLFFVPEAFRHGIHGVATLFITVGMYDLVRTRLRVERAVDWTELLHEESVDAELAGDD